VSLSNRHTLSLAFSVAAPAAPVRVEDPKVESDFLTLLCGSNTGTSAEAHVCTAGAVGRKGR
jgi:hypothetical protein